MTTLSIDTLTDLVTRCEPEPQFYLRVGYEWMPCLQYYSRFQALPSAWKSKNEVVGTLYGVEIRLDRFEDPKLVEKVYFDPVAQACHRMEQIADAAVKD